MSTIQIRDKLTTEVMASKRVDVNSTHLQKDTVARQLATEVGESRIGPYSFEDMYATEMVANTCINKWDLY